MPVTYLQEPLFQVKKEATELARQDWEETTKFKDSHPFEIDWDLYELLESIGSLLVFTARDGEKLVGYFSVIKTPDMHSKGRFFFTNDAIFLHKDYRKGLAGVGLIKFVEKCLREDGCDHLQIAFTTEYNIGKLLKRLGYHEIEIRFEKRLV